MRTVCAAPLGFIIFIVYVRKIFHGKTWSEALPTDQAGFARSFMQMEMLIRINQICFLGVPVVRTTRRIRRLNVTAIRSRFVTNFL